jgi:hypothetical protein
LSLTEGKKGALSGIAFLIDPIGGIFYRLVCDFKNSDPMLNLAYVGNETRNFPVYLAFWDERQVPGGIPKESARHTMAVRVKDGRLTAYWNGKELRGGPSIVDRIKRDFVGCMPILLEGLERLQPRLIALF